MEATMTLEQKLAMIDKLMNEAGDDKAAQVKILESAIIDPQDSLNCEGCQ